MFLLQKILSDSSKVCDIHDFVACGLGHQAGLGPDRIWKRKRVGIWEGGSYEICNKEIEPIIVDPTPQKLAEHIPFVPVNLTSPFI